MQLAEQLRRAGLYVFPCWVRYDESKQKWAKGPKVPKGESWKLAALRPVDDPALDWSSDTAGLPIPKGVLILDGDTYAGADRGEFEQWIGGPVDWEAARIQKTISGGDHYATYCPWPAHQMPEGIPRGWDVRVAGKGFICTGKGYEQIGAGVFRLLSPSSLPHLPPSAEAVLAPPPERRTDADPPTYEPLRELSDLEAALRYIDPSGDRGQWVRAGLALKHYFQEDDEQGRDVFRRWSSGEFWGDVPHNFVPDHIDSQWDSFKVEGGVTSATLFYKAIQGGWAPPATFDTSIAFQGPAAPASVFNDLLAEVRESGGAVERTSDLIDQIRNSGCNPLQVALLASELKTALREVGIKDKQVEKQVDALLDQTGNDRVRSFIPEVGSNIQFLLGENLPFDSYILPNSRLPGDDVNDALHLLALYKQRLQSANGKFHWWSGRIWEPLSDAAVKRSIGLAIRGDSKKASSSRVRSIFEEMRNQAKTIELDPPAPRVYFLNGVLHIPSGEFTPHNPSNGNSRTLSVQHDPAAHCPQWFAWLQEIFASEPQRIALLQEMIGWILVRDLLGIEKALLFIGPPRAGKGVISRVIHALLGSGATTFRLNELDDGKILAAMRGKTAAIDPDAVSAAPRNARAVMGLFKAITSNDSISLPLLYTQEPWTGQLSTKLLIIANSVPAMFDDSAATGNRWVPIVFDRSFLGSEDPQLFSRLSGELPGIAAWAVNGLLRLAQRGRFELPQSSRDQLDVLLSDGGSVQDFVNEVLQIGEQFRCNDVALWDAYRQWAVSTGHEIGKRRHVLKALEDALRGKGVRRSAGVRFEDGVTRRGFYGINILQTKSANNVLAFQPKDK